MKALVGVLVVLGVSTSVAQTKDPFVQVAAATPVCAVRASGAVACMTGDDGVLRPVASLTNVAKIAVHDKLVCAALRDGKVACVELDPTRAATLFVPPIEGAVDVTFLAHGVCALHEDRRPTCFDVFDTRKRMIDHTYPSSTKQIAHGQDHACALVAGGELQCAGGNGRGQLEGASTIKNATAVAAANEHTCVIVKGAVKCWGTHYQGALGQGAKKIEVGKVVTIPRVAHAVEIEAKAWTTCARTRAGDAICWGTNSSGELGDKTLTDRASPIKLPIGKVVDLSLAHERTCAVLADGNVTCFGEMPRSRPAKVPGLTGVVSLVAGRDGTCARLRDGSTRCWGRFGSLVGKDAFGMLATPAHIAELDAFRELALATDTYDWRSCGVLADGQLGCYMLPPHDGGDVTKLAAKKRIVHRLRLDATPAHPSMMGSGVCVSTTRDARCVWPDEHAKEKWAIRPVPALTNGKQLAVGSHAICGIIAADGVACTELPEREGSVGTPVAVPGITNAVAIASNFKTSCVIDKSGAITCFEYDAGNKKVTYTARVAGISDAVSLAMAGASCAVRRTGAVVCFRAPTGTPPGAAELAPVAGITDATQIVGGLAHTCVLHRGGTVSCWGDNQYGQLGDGRGAGHPWIVPSM